MSDVCEKLKQGCVINRILLSSKFKKQFKSKTLDQFFSIIYSYRNKDAVRVRRSLDSLAHQTKKNFEVIFVDYGSDQEYSDEAQEILKDYPFAKYIYTETRGLPWNRSHALNTGIRIATSDFIFTADIDLIFIRDFSTIVGQMQEPRVAVFFSFYLLPENFKQWERLFEYKDFVYITNQGLGISLIDRSALVKKGGYNEFFTFWGYEDNELYHRLTEGGLKTSFFDETIIAYHQWHPYSFEEGKNFPYDWRKFMGDSFSYQKENPSIVSFDNNGLIYTVPQRKALTHLRLSEKWIVLKGGLPFMRFFISNTFDALQEPGVLCFRFQANEYRVYEKSTATRALKFVNSVMNQMEWFPFNIKSKYERLNISVFQVRDMIMYLIYEKQSMIQDYAFDISEDETVLKFTLEKKQTRY